MVLKFSVHESRFVNMGVNMLKQLVQEAKSSNGVITLEATVITGFEGSAIDECRAKCKPLKCSRAKGRIFFNIQKETFPNVLKMRSIDNVFLVSEVFEELKLKKIKEEDLLTVKNLVDNVDWKRSVPEWAEIVGFKGVQFPRCAQNDPEGLKEEGHVCQSCLAKSGGDLTQNEGGGGPQVECDSAVDSTEKGCESPKVNLVPPEDVFQTPDACPLPESRNSAPKKLPSDEKRDGEKRDSALESSPEAQPLPAKEAEGTDDESAFHSAEEELSIENLKIEEPPAAPDAAVKQIQSSQSEICSDGSNIHLTELILSNESSNDAANKPSSRAMGGLAPERAKREKKKRRDKRKGGRDTKDESEVMKSESGDTSKIVEGKGDSECASLGSNELNENVSHAGSEPAEGKKKGYWARRKEARAKKDAEAKNKKPPRKAYVDDGIMKFRVTCYRNGPKHSFDSNDAAGHFGGHINDKFHWTVDLTRFDINVVLVIEDDSAYVTLALTNKSLHKRNIKHFGPTTLRATLCYGLLCLAEPRVGDIVMDPMCGGGSIPIEGALAFPGTFHICGDVNGKSVATTGDNIAHNSQSKPLLVDALQWSVRRLPLQDNSVDVFVSDLPFGLRVGRQKDNTGLYIAALTESARVVRLCGRASLLTYDKTAMIRALQKTRHLWREIRSNMVNQGGLRCYAFLLLRKASPTLPPEAVQEPARDLPLADDRAAQGTLPESKEAPPDCATSDGKPGAADDRAVSNDGESFEGLAESNTQLDSGEKSSDDTNRA